MAASACNTDACKDVTCNNGGTCADGTCLCADGYEGTNCDTEMRAKFLGNFNITESCSSGTDTYSCVIATSSSNVANISFSNLYNSGIAVSGTVNGTAVTIASQSLATATISGSGVISTTGVITLTYTVSVGGNSDTCTMTMTPV